ncbi:unnamed protein product [Leptidea sinapis]|uniref:Uncharacterized protein n=1 Tax=Leptidea sinapis TaxID=189913 RepID=A0A5E4PR05_9NEOP|nr:unnamed protein product [Leptidea sinapis]
MAHYTILCTIFCGIIGIYAGVVKENTEDLRPLSSPAHLTYDELVYLLQSRFGTQNVAKPMVLSPCAKAILGCCKEGSMDVSCSETLKCGAHFFDDNPCGERFIISALDAATKYYNQFGKA